MVCPHCWIKEKTTPYQKKVFKLALGKDVAELYNANPKGCDKCNKGYHGRIAIQEVLMINDEIRNALNEENLEKDDLNKMVYTSDVITMLQDGLLKVLDGSTTFDEIYKIIDVDDDLDVYCKIRGIEYNENNEESKDRDKSETAAPKLNLESKKETKTPQSIEIEENTNNEITPETITIEDKQKEEEIL